MENKTHAFPTRILAFLSKHKLISIVSIVALVVLISSLIAVLNGTPKAVTVVKSSLTGFSDISELSVLEYPYNSYTTVYKKDKNNENISDKPLYYVAYEGTVKMGFNFEKIKVSEDKDKKTIYIEIPTVEIQSASIDQSTLDFIFIDEKSETTDVVAKSISICKNDLESKVNGENGDSLRLVANENAISTIKAITEPLIKHLPDGYVIEYR